MNAPLKVVALSLLAFWGCFGSAAGRTSGQPPPSSELVEIRLASGRTLRGYVDARSSETALVLRLEKTNAYLLRTIAWDRIAGATDAEGDIPPAELRPRLLRRASPTPPPNYPSPAEPGAEATGPQPPAARATSLAADAFLANWDADLETDGLVLNLAPTSAQGELAAVAGLLEVELYAVQYRDFSAAPAAGGRTIERVARWTQPVRPADYSASGAALRLPFQAVHPEHQLDRGFYGLVHLRLSLPGTGVFERTLDGVRIRPWAPVRDVLEQTTGFRWVTPELPSRGRNWASQP